MQKREKHPVRWSRLAAVLLAFAVMLTTPNLFAPEARAVTQAEIDALKKDAGALNEQKAELEQQLKAIQADKNKAQEQKQLLEQQINLIQAEIDNIAGQIAMYDELIAAKAADLDQAILEEQEQYQLFCRRVRYMEEEGSVSYWSILFNARDFSDLLDRLILVDEIMAYDDAVMDNLVRMRQRIEVEQAELEQIQAGQLAAKAEQEAARADLKAREAEVDRLIRQINAKEDEVEAAEKALIEEAKRIEEEIARKQKELEAQLREIKSEAGYLWPLKGYSNLTSLYAGRKDPFTGKPATHTGIDVGAPKGTPILAAKSGVVTISAYNQGGYGNYVVIGHDNSGSTTLYAHMSSRAVKEGQTVKQGQVIGYVGSTGRSTAPHLHFEIREKGTRIDPVIRFTGLTYYGTPIKD